MRVEELTSISILETVPSIATLALGTRGHALLEPGQGLARQQLCLNIDYHRHLWYKLEKNPTQLCQPLEKWS